MAKHAPAPFKISREGRGRVLIKATHSDGNQYAIAQVMAGAFGTQTADATAQLFETAPELFEACKAALDWINRFAEHGPAQFGGEAALAEQLRIAINKALGGTEAAR